MAGWNLPEPVNSFCMDTKQRHTVFASYNLSIRCFLPAFYQVITILSSRRKHLKCRADKPFSQHNLLFQIYSSAINNTGAKRWKHGFGLGLEAGGITFVSIQALLIVAVALMAANLSFLIQSREGTEDPKQMIGPKIAVIAVDLRNYCSLIQWDISACTFLCVPYTDAYISFLTVSTVTYLPVYAQRDCSEGVLTEPACNCTSL